MLNVRSKLRNSWDYVGAVLRAGCTASASWLGRRGRVSDAGSPLKFFNGTHAFEPKAVEPRNREDGNSGAHHVCSEASNVEPLNRCCPPTRLKRLPTQTHSRALPPLQTSETFGLGLPEWRRRIRRVAGNDGHRLRLQANFAHEQHTTGHTSPAWTEFNRYFRIILRFNQFVTGGARMSAIVCRNCRVAP